MAPQNWSFDSQSYFPVTIHEGSSAMLENLKQRVGLPHSKKGLSVLFAWHTVVLKRVYMLFNVFECRLCCRSWPAVVGGRMTNHESANWSVWEDYTGKEHLLRVLLGFNQGARANTFTPKAGGSRQWFRKELDLGVSYCIKTYSLCLLFKELILGPQMYCQKGSLITPAALSKTQQCFLSCYSSVVHHHR